MKSLQSKNHLWIVRPDVLSFGLMMVTHIALGYEYYVSNRALLLSTLWFLLVMWVMGYVFNIAKKIDISSSFVDLRLPSIYFSRLSMSMVWLILIVGIIHSGFLAYYAFYSGISFEILRLRLSDIWPPALFIPIDGAMAAAFPLAVLRGLKFSDGKYKHKLRNYVLLVVVFSTYMWSGSRSSSMYFVWMFVFISFYFRIYKIHTLIIAALMGLVFFGLISYLRLINSDDPGILNWYVNEGIVELGDSVTSAVRLISFQIQDIVLRDSSIFLYVPDKLDFQYGKSIFFGFYSILPGEQTNPAVLVHHQIFEVALNRNTGYPPTTVSQMYLDFGYLGVFVGSVIYAGIYWKLYRALCNSSTTVFLIIVFGAFFYFYVLSFYGAFESLRFFLILFTLVVINVISSMLKTTKKMHQLY